MMFKEYREKLNLTIEELAKLTNLNSETIKNIENNKCTPQLKTLKKLIKVLKISNQDILNYLKISSK